MEGVSRSLFGCLRRQAFDEGLKLLATDPGRLRVKIEHDLIVPVAGIQEVRYVAQTADVQP